MKARALACAGLAALGAAQATTVSVDTSSALHTAEPGWPGFNVDTACLHNQMDLADPYLVTAASQLARVAPSTPLTLRVGGTASDHSIFLPGDGPAYPTPDGGTVLTDGALKALDAFATSIGARLIFGIPYITTPEGGAWDPSNATAILASVGRQGLRSFMGWSMGNEIIGGAGFNNAQYAADYVAFRANVTALGPAWAQAVFGPSAAGFPGPDVIGPFMTATAAGGLAQSGGGLSFHA